MCRQIFTSESGIIKSPGYPDKYRSHEECAFIVEQPPGKIIQLEFQDFDFELISVCFYDYIEVFPFLVVSFSLGGRDGSEVRVR